MAMASAQALSRVLSSSSACSSSSSSSSSSRKKKTITTKNSSRGRRVIASSSSSSSSSSSESNNSPRRKKGCKPLKAILEPCVLEPRSMDEDDENCETEKIVDAKTKRTMTSNHDENRSAATIVKTDFLVRFILSSITSFRRGLRRRKEEQAEDDETIVYCFVDSFFFTCR